MAILAGDGLLSTAAEIVTGCPLEHSGDPVKMRNHIRAAHEIMSRAGWENVTAVKNGAILNLQNDELSRPAPRLADGAKMLYDFVMEKAEALQPAA